MHPALPTQSAAAPALRRPELPALDITKTDETLDLAKDLAKFIKENRLSTSIQGREFVNVEGWQYAGSRLGIVPVVEAILNLSTELELKYQAQVRLFDLRSQAYIGAGFAVCSNKENGKKFYQEFAIASMAQTRAIGKAYRNVLAWIIRAAGYEPTPVEEMDYQGAGPGGATGAPAQVSEPVMRAVTTTPAPVVELELEAAPVEYASAELKENIIRLLNHPKISRQEKTKVLLNINRYDKERAEARIRQLVGFIEERTGQFVTPNSRFYAYTTAPAGASTPVLTTAPGTTTAAAEAPAPASQRPRRTNSRRETSEGKLRDFVVKHADYLGKPEVDRLLTICANPRFSPADIDAELEAANAYLLESPAA